MHRFKRSDRVSALIKREISIIIDQELRDFIKNMVTVTDVEMSRDLKNAKVFVSVLGSEGEIKSSLAALNSVSHSIREQLKVRIILKYFPRISFFYDSSTVYGMHIDKLLDEIKNKY
ncbi:30S ribosome-binding factor RbfA [Candidatus Latescibacterota bacterium]